MKSVRTVLGATALASFFMTGCALMAASGPRDYILVENIFQVPDSDAFGIADLRIENDSLKFVASYGGGCREHVFTLYAARGEVEDAGHLYIQHNANHDLCRAFVPDDTVAFSLAGLRRDLDLDEGSTLSLAARDSLYALRY